MTIQLKPETEALIELRLQSGAFSTPEEVIERALEMLSIEEDWLVENVDVIRASIQEGWGEADRGELIDDEQVRADMQQYKSGWIREHAVK